MVNAIYEKIYGVNTPVQTTPSATIAAGGTVTQNLPVDSAMGSMTISFFTSDSGINLTLTQPDGSPVDLDSPSVTHTVGEGYETYTILAPQTGTWTTSVSSSIAGEYALSVSTMDAMTVSVATDKDEYVAGDPIVFTASVNDSTSGSLLAPPNYILGATIQVTAEDPARQQATFELYDDGQHDDGEENDGIYANTFSNTSLAGVYNFKIQISGNNNRDGQPFTREEALPVVVLAPPNVVSSLRASVNPTNYHSVDYTVTFSEPVTGVDASDFVLTTSGLSGAEVSVVSGSDSEYTVTVAAGDGVGTLRLDVVDDDTIVDGDGIPLGRAGIGNGDFSTGETYTIDRTAPASVVTKLDDTNDGFCDADCSLREAIGAAAPGDTVAFDSALSGGVIRLASTLTLSRDITIDASALSAPVTISGDRYNDGMKHVRVFHISTGISAVLNNLVISMSLSGGIHNTGALTVENCIFLNNDRGISNVGGTLVVSNSVFSNNAATYHAGGIFNSGTATIVNSAFSGNTSTYGGGISNRGTVTIANSAFSDNASTYGGGIYNEVGSTTTIMNSTFSVNMASSHGSGIYNAGTLNYANTIIANSASGGDCYNSGAIGVNTNNLVEDGSCAAGSSGDPLLDALADNGGPTQTMALLPGSPAIDAGDDATCADAPVDGLDQRGVARPQGPHCDIGAYEAQDVTPPTVQSITLASANPTSAASVDFTVTFSEPVAGVDVSDFSLAVTGDISGASVSAAAAAGSQAVYTVTVDAGVGGGALRLDIPTTATIADLIGTPLAGLPYQSGEEYTILVTAPGKASLVSPSGDIGDNYYPAYTWQEVTEGGAESISTWYYLWVNGPSGNIIKQWYPAAEVCSSGVCSVTPSTALGGGAHTWWVQTWNSAGYGPWSDAMTFDTAVPTVPGKAVLVSPSGNAVSNTPTYTWNEVTESGAESMSTWYYLWVNGPAGNVIKQWYKAVDICDAGLCAATPATALASGAHTWWVQTWNPAGYGPWSDAMTFNTAIPAMTVTPSATATDTPTPVETPSATIIVDEFEESLLDPDWEWYLPAAGPEYSLDADPGYLQLVIPSGFDHWSDQDYAPQVRRDDMGDGDWAIETWLALDDTNAGDAWQVNLLAGFDRYDQQWLSIASDDTLRVTRVGGDDTAFVAEISLPLYLRIEKTGNEYTFKYKEPDGEQWQVLGSQSIETPVKNVGLQFRTFYTSSGDAVFDVDYFRLERLGSLAPEPEKEIDVDEFDDASLASGWEWYAPLEGPTYSSNNGLFSMYLPAFSGFEHWVDVDNAPQLRRTDLGEGNWAIETQLEAINAAPDAAYWVALEAGFDQYDQLWFGMLDNGSLGAIRVGEGGSFIEKPESMPIILRLEKEGESYIFKCRHDPDEAWTILAAREYAGTPQYVGLLGRGFITGSDDLTIDWSYFQLERWASAGARMTPQSLHGAQGKIAATLGKGQTPAALGTPSRQPTSAASPTATVTPTPPRTPTPTLTPTEAEEE
ncbi:MAG: choice-of-anchor Q domain-containing protein [Chloroflexota bacterium]